MKAKIVVGILLAVACLCLLTVYGVSQPTYPPQPPNSSIPFPVPNSESPPPQLPGSTPPMPKEGRLEQLAQQLRNVRQQKKALEAQEDELLKRIDLEVEEQRKALQKAEELRKQLRQEKPLSEEENRFLDKDKNKTAPYPIKPESP